MKRCFFLIVSLLFVMCFWGSITVFAENHAQKQRPINDEVQILPQPQQHEYKQGPTKSNKINKNTSHINNDDKILPQSKKYMPKQGVTKINKANKNKPINYHQAQPYVKKNKKQPRYKYDAKVYSAQKKLKMLGYNPGQCDGIWGGKTAHAIKRFQQDYSLIITLMLDKNTQIHLEKAIQKLQHKRHQKPKR